MSAKALVQLEGDVNCIITIDTVKYHSYDGESFRAPDDRRVSEADPELEDLLDALWEICGPHCDETQYLTATVDLNTLEIDHMTLEEPE